MQINNTNQMILIVTGMHRSGTSLTTSLLQSAGVDVGQRLMAPYHGNVKGYFENLDFVEFHQTVLRSQHVDDSGWTLQDKVNVEGQFLELAEEVVEKNSEHSIWGWKDPRTTLFLDFWAKFLPNANFIFVYRSPWEVVDSLYRRALQSEEIFFEHPDFAVKVWMHYNQRILDFQDQFPARCLLTSVYSVANKTRSFLDAISKKFGIHLDSPAEDIYDRSLLHTQFSDLHRPALVGHYFPQSLEIYRELIQREARSFAGNLTELPDLSWFDEIQTSPYRIWAFRDWMNLRKLETRSKQLTGQLEQTQLQQQQTQAHVQHLQTELQQLQVQYQNTHVELQQSQAQFHHTHTELEQFKAQFHHSQNELQQSKTDLQQLQIKLYESKAESEHTHHQLSQTQMEFLQSQSHLEQSRSQLQQTQSQLNQTQTQLNQTQAQLNQTQAQLGQTRLELEQTRIELHQLYTQFQQTCSELEQTQVRAEQLHTELKDTQLQLQSAQTQLQNCQITVAAMETSKFWKLRQVWFRIRGALGVKGN